MYAPTASRSSDLRKRRPPNYFLSNTNKAFEPDAIGNVVIEIRFGFVDLSGSGDTVSLSRGIQ